MARRGAPLVVLVGVACLWPAAALRRALADHDVAVEKPTRRPVALAKSTAAPRAPAKLAKSTPARRAAAKLAKNASAPRAPAENASAPRESAKNASAPEGKRVVDAWLLMAHGQMSLEKNMYTPLMLPLEDSLQSVGAVTRVIDQSSLDEMVAGVKRSRAAKRTPLVVAVAVHKALPDTSKAITQCVEEGAYLAIYSTEPAKSSVFGRLAKQYKAGEIWEYSLSNIGRYPKELLEEYPVRYLPPAYSPRLVVNGSLIHKSRMEDKLAFLGGMNGRPKPIQNMVNRVLGSKLVTTVKVWNNQDLRKFLDKYPLQLNIHKAQTCCPHDKNEVTAMEAFRLAPLLSNAACVISTPAPELDEPEWRDIVHFAEVNKIPEVMKDLQENVVGCQKEGKKRFMEHFNSTRLLYASGLLSVWQPGRLMLSAASSKGE